MVSEIGETYRPWSNGRGLRGVNCVLLVMVQDLGWVPTHIHGAEDFVAEENVKYAIEDRETAAGAVETNCADC